MDEQQTPDEEVAEIKLRIALKLYDSVRPIRLRPADIVRVGVTAQNSEVAEQCIHDLSVTIAEIWTEKPSGKKSYKLRENKRDWINASAGRPNSQGMTWANRVRQVLAAADRGEIIPGERARLWNEAYSHW